MQDTGNRRADTLPVNRQGCSRRPLAFVRPSYLSGPVMINRRFLHSPLHVLLVHQRKKNFIPQRLGACWYLVVLRGWACV